MHRVAFIETSLSGSGLRAMERARELGCEVVFVTRDRNYYTARGVPGVRRLDRLATVVDCESNDATIVAKALVPLGVDAVLSPGEYHVEIAAQVADLLGLAGLSPMAGWAARHKRHAMQLCTEAGVPVPRYAAVTQAERAAAAAAEIGYPLVVKPVDGTASAGVRLCHTPDEVVEHVAGLLGRTTNPRAQPCVPEALLVEYVPGPEVSVETISRHGAVTVLGITAKRVGPLPYFVEIGHTFPAALAAEQAARCAQVTRTALAAIGLRTGAAHTELRLAPHGPVLMEINARPAGDHITDLVRLATGIDPLREWVRSHLDGERPDLVPTRRAAAAIRYLTLPPGTVSRIGSLEPVRRRAGVHEVLVRARPGDRITPTRSSHDRTGYVIVRGADPQAAMSLADEVHDALPIDVVAAGRTADDRD